MCADRPDVSLPAEAILDAAPDAVLLVDADGRVVFANDRLTDVLGYEPGEVIDQPVELFLPEDDRDAHVSERTAYFADPTARPMAAGLDLYARRKDGTSVPVDVSLGPIDVDGERKVMAVVRDITDRREFRRKYRTILEAVPDAVVVADVGTGEIVEANERVADFFGYDPEELIGRHQTVLHPRGEEDRYRSLFEAHVASGRRIFTELLDGSDVLVETKAGDRFPVEINARVFELGDRRLIAGVFRDVTARQARERQLEAIHETTRRLVEADSPEEVADVVAEAASTILGYSASVVRFVVDGTRLRPAAVTEQARAELGPRPEYPLDGDSPPAVAFASGEPSRYDDVRTIDDGYDRGDVRSAMYVPVGDHGVMSVVDPSVGAFDAADVDLASILAADAETALNRIAYERELERQNERLEEFTRVVSHDLRNPLGVARGWLEYVESPGDERERIASALDRMDAIIDDTLTLARQGRTVAEREPIDVADVAAECWGMVSTPGARLEIVDEFVLLGDRDRLRHVLENLFRNAVDHGGEDVLVKVGTVDDPAGFYVEDDGAGIPPSEREHVFEPGRSVAPGGTGFGLTIVEGIAAAHGWDVHVTDAAGGGARFEFTGVEFA